MFNPSNHLNYLSHRHDSIARKSDIFNQKIFQILWHTPAKLPSQEDSFSESDGLKGNSHF